MLKRTFTKSLFLVVTAILVSGYSQLLSQNFWQLTGNTSTSFAIRPVVTNANGDIFLGTGGGTSGEGNGIFRSTDGGNIWTQSGLSDLFIWDIEIDGNGNIFVGTSKEGRIFRSSDNGDNWSQVYNSSVSSNITNCLLYTPSGSVLAGLDGTGIVRSTNNGDTWNTTSLVSQNIREMVATDNGDIIPLQT